MLPHGIKVGGWRDAAQFLAAVAGELALRQQPDASEAPELFLFVHDLARFRDLRRREDDFGFGRKEDDLAPPDHLDMILREGPGLGVHLIAWCDTVNNLNRYYPGNKEGHIPTRSASEGPMKSSETRRGSPLDD